MAGAPRGVVFSFAVTYVFGVTPTLVGALTLHKHFVGWLLAGACVKCSTESKQQRVTWTSTLTVTKLQHLYAAFQPLVAHVLVLWHYFKQNTHDIL